MQALDGIRVIDMSTVLAGPEAARHLADFGADVIKVEAPAGDRTRRMGWRRPGDDDSLMWKLASRNKRCVVLDLKTDEGRAALLRLADEAHVLVENFRPGTLERLGLGPAILHARNPRLVVVRVTGFGQDGPYRDRPGFATLAEAMSGFAAVNGEPDGRPLPPPIALADELTGLVAAFAAMVALRHAERTGEGQVVDANLLESMFQVMGPMISAYRHVGYLQPRLGAGIPYSVPRGTYRTRDGRWLALSASAESVAERVLELIGVAGDPRFATFEGRVEHRDALEERVSAWIAARDADEVVAAFVEANAAIAPVYTMADIDEDPHVAARGMVVEVDGVAMPGPVARLSATPARLTHAGRPLGADSADVLAHGFGSPDATRPEEDV
ncbi:MAG TPA: CoA transferase [Acidimicrobiia bacterium]|nr:CoA transferase [Acidimicrobiia bacterium]